MAGCSAGCPTGTSRSELSGPVPRFTGARTGQGGRVSFLFSNRLGCLGSVLVSLLLTVLLFVLFTVW